MTTDYYQQHDLVAKKRLRRIAVLAVTLAALGIGALGLLIATGLTATAPDTPHAAAVSAQVLTTGPSAATGPSPGPTTPSPGVSAPAAPSHPTGAPSAPPVATAATPSPAGRPTTPAPAPSRPVAPPPVSTPVVAPAAPMTTTTTAPPSSASVPNVVGLTPGAASAALASAGFFASGSCAVGGELVAGAVTSQSPKAGTTATLHSTVAFDYSIAQTPTNLDPCS